MPTRDARTAIRAGLADTLAWGEAHATFDAAVKGLAPRLRGRRPLGFEHSAWQLVEHLRRAQHDLLDFCLNPSYQALSWPDDYWPKKPAPPSAGAWSKSIAAYRRDRAAFQALVRNPKRGLDDKIPHGAGQTYLREVLLAIDHNSYHVGQLGSNRHALGAWPK
jgi:hypothetical protein